MQASVSGTRTAPAVVGPPGRSLVPARRFSPHRSRPDPHRDRTSRQALAKRESIDVRSTVHAPEHFAPFDST
jgi:hypothetical protein